MKVRPYCHAILPAAGLGNKLLVWARAFVFAQNNGLPLVVTGWSRLVGQTALHRGGDLRLYGPSFRATDEIGKLQRWLLSRWLPKCSEPPLEANIDPSEAPAVYVFEQVPSWRDYFAGIREHREAIKCAFEAMLATRIRKDSSRLPALGISMHVRLGDYRPLRAGEDFAKVGLVRTPQDHFVRVIDGITRLCGKVIPVHLFSDGDDADLAALIRLPGVVRAERRSPVLDLIAMSRSKVLIQSAGSTFGYWAGFLGDGAILLHPDHVHARIRSETLNPELFEGGAGHDPYCWPEHLQALVRQL